MLGERSRRVMASASRRSATGRAWRSKELQRDAIGAPRRRRPRRTVAFLWHPYIPLGRRRLAAAESLERCGAGSRSARSEVRRAGCSNIDGRRAVMCGSRPCVRRRPSHTAAWTRAQRSAAGTAPRLNCYAGGGTASPPQCPCLLSRHVVPPGGRRTLGAGDETHPLMMSSKIVGCLLRKHWRHSHPWLECLVCRYKAAAGGGAGVVGPPGAHHGAMLCRLRRKRVEASHCGAR
jgi:hypothetical protein